MKYFAALLAALVFAGCKSTTSIDIGRSNPTFEITDSGVKFAGEYINPRAAPKLLKDNEVPESRVIYIKVAEFDEFSSDASKETFNEGKVAANHSMRLKEARAFMSILWYSGYRKSVLVTEEQSTSWSRAGEDSAQNKGALYDDVEEVDIPSRANSPKTPVKIRYRSSSEDDEDED